MTSQMANRPPTLKNMSEMMAEMSGGMMDMPESPMWVATVQGGVHGAVAITNSKEIPGAKLTIFDKDGKEIESWISEEKPHYIEKLPVGEYTLREVTAPDGYEVAEDVKFSVAETGEIQTVVMKDKPKKQPETTPTTEKPTTPDNPTNPTSPSTPTTSKETPKETPTTPKTGDDRNPLIWLLLLGIGGCMAGAAWYLRKKDEKDQNQD